MARESPKLTGLLNHNKVTCFVNSPVQTLFHIPQFRNAILALTTEETGEDTWRAIGDPTIEKPVLMSMQHLFAELALSDQSSLSTKDLTSSFGWDPFAISESDVGEMTAFLIDRIREDFRTSTKNPTFVDDLMRVFIELRIKCLKCEATRTASKDHYLSIPIPCEEHDDLLQVLENSCKPTQATGANKINCPVCQEKTESSQSYTYVNAPPVLGFAINRFQIDFKRGRRVKLTSKLAFPEEFDFSKFLGTKSDGEQKSSPGSEAESGDDSHATSGDGSIIYDLCAVTIHSGGAKHGHFNAYIRPDSLFNPERKWFNFNDDKIKPISSDVLAESFGGSSSAYMLLYSRRDQNTDQTQPRDLIPESIRSRIEDDNAQARQAKELEELKRNQVPVKVYTPSSGFQVVDSLLSLPIDTSQSLSDLKSLECVIDKRNIVRDVTQQLLIQYAEAEESKTGVESGQTSSSWRLHRISQDESQRTIFLSDEFLDASTMSDCGVYKPSSLFLFNNKTFDESFEPTLNKHFLNKAQFYNTPIAEYKSPRNFEISLCRGTRLHVLCDRIASDCELPVDDLLIHLVSNNIILRKIEHVGHREKRLCELGIPDDGSFAVEKAPPDGEKSLAAQYMAFFARMPNFYWR